MEQADYEKRRVELIAAVEAAKSALIEAEADLSAWDRVPRIMRIVPMTASIKVSAEVKAKLLARIPAPKASETHVMVPEGHGWEWNVRRALAMLPQEFTAPEVKRVLIDEFLVPETKAMLSNVSGTVSRLANEKRGIELVHQGAGSRPSRYRKVNGTPSEEGNAP